MIDETAYKTAVRTWVVDALAPTVPDERVIFGEQSGPRPVYPYAEVSLVSVIAPEQDEQGEMELYPIIAVDQANKRFTVAGDRTALFPAGNKVQVVDATNTPPRNDGTYTVASVALVAGDTQVTVVEAVPSAAVSGYLTGAREVMGDRVLTFAVNLLGTQAAQLADRVKTALQLEASVDKLRTAGLVVYRSTDVLRLPEQIDSGWLERARFETRFCAVSRTPEYTGVIEEVEFTSELQEAGVTVAQGTVRVVGP